MRAHSCPHVKNIFPASVALWVHVHRRAGSDLADVIGASHRPGRSRGGMDRVSWPDRSGSCERDWIADRVVDRKKCLLETTGTWLRMVVAGGQQGTGHP